MTPVVILAGGKGTRIESIAQDLPKPMIKVHDRPILELQIDCLSEQGFTDVVLIVGHRKEVIKNYFGDGSLRSPVSGLPFGVNIRYVEETEPLGTGGGLALLKGLVAEDFLLLCGDIVFDVDFHRFLTFHRECRTKGAMATLLTHPNNHPYDSGLVVADDQNRVIDWLHKEDKRQWYRNRVNAGIHAIALDLLERLPGAQKLDLDRDLLKPLVKSSELYCYDSSEYVKDMGTPDRYRAVIADIEKGIVRSKNLALPQKAIFLDRDGTINRLNGFIAHPDDFQLLPEVTLAIQKINQSGYLCIVVTNQPVVARGECTLEDLETIHNKMETELGKEGAYLDRVYYCPHHPDGGFAGERAEYKVSCQCRKPEPGLLLQAAKEFNIDLKASWMIGDSGSDIKAGQVAGCHVAGVGRSPAVSEEGVSWFQDLSSCVDFILEE